MSEKKRKAFTLDPENKEFLDSQDNASAVVNDLVDQLRRGNASRDVAALQLRRSQKQKEVERVREKLEGLENDLAEIDALIAEFESEVDPELEKALEKLENTPRDPENPAIQRWARKVELTPSDLVGELEQYHTK